MPSPLYSFWTDEQGNKIAGSVTVQGREESVEIYSLEHTVFIPEDELTGKVTGTRKHTPVSILVQIDKATPYFFSACARGKNFQSVEFKFYRINDMGQEEEYYNLLLERVKVVSVKTFVPDIKDPANDQYVHHAQIKLRYEKITYKYLDGNIEFSDEWDIRA